MTYSSNSTILANNILREWKKRAVEKTLSETPGLAAHISADNQLSRNIKGFLSSKGLSHTNNPRKDDFSDDIFGVDDHQADTRSTRELKTPFTI